MHLREKKTGIDFHSLFDQCIFVAKDLVHILKSEKWKYHGGAINKFDDEIRQKIKTLSPFNSDDELLTLEDFYVVFLQKWLNNFASDERASEWFLLTHHYVNKWIRYMYRVTDMANTQKCKYIRRYKSVHPATSLFVWENEKSERTHLSPGARTIVHLPNNHLCVRERVRIF